ncbi:MAG: GAF domain-containing protein [Chryseolinea sp.]
MNFFHFKKFSLSQQFLIVSIGTISIILIGVSTYMVRTSVSSKIEQLQVMADGRSSAVIEKIDRNFYERFGDVQAFAFNKLAVQAATIKKTDSDIERFVNTMVSYYVLYDLMMICDLEGKVIVLNTLNKEGKAVKSNFLLGKTYAKEEWFRVCVSGAGPKGGAWYSDFLENKDVTRMYDQPGYGMAFAAPIRDSTGAAIGVWYNFANWSDVTTGIRNETEELIKQTEPEAFMLITNANDIVIDSDESEMILQTRVTSNADGADATFRYQRKVVDPSQFIIGSKKGTGAYTFKGKNWNALTFVPRTQVSFAYLKGNLLGLFVVMLLVLIGVGYVFYKLASVVSKRITTLKNDITKLSKGELVEIEDSNLENEVGEMTSAIKTLVKGMSETALFAKQIGEDNLTATYTPLSDKDVLGLSLITMRNNLLKFRVENEQRDWANNALAKIGELLRSTHKNVTDLYDSIIRYVVKYTKSNQGGIFLLDGTDNELNLVCCYAYERKKFMEKRVAIGQGLVGQCFLSREIIYMTDVPKNYVQISSGLGESTPNAVILVPLAVNDDIVGVLELASLQPYSATEIELLRKLAESVASTIAEVQINDRTKQLLEISQQQAEEMKASEEEIRQNMEELSATQEEMGRKEREYLKRIEDLENQILKESVK